MKPFAFSSDRPVTLKDVTDFQAIEGVVNNVREALDAGREPREGDLWRLAHNGLAFYTKNVGEFVDDPWAD